MFAHHGGFGAVELGVAHFVEERGPVLLGLRGPEGGGGRGGKKGVAQVGVVNGAAIKGVVGQVQGFGVKLRLFADGVGDGRGELARQRVLPRHLAREVLRAVERVVDVPFKLVNEGDAAEGDVQADGHPQLIVPLLVVGAAGLERAVVDDEVGVEVLQLLVHLAAHLPRHLARSVGRQAQVLDQRVGEDVGRDEALVQVPREGVAHA